MPSVYLDSLAAGGFSTPYKCCRKLSLDRHSLLTSEYKLYVPSDQCLHTVLIEILLRCECVKHVIIRKGFILPQNYLWRVGSAGSAYATHINELSCILRTYSRSRTKNSINHWSAHIRCRIQNEVVQHFG